MSLQTIDLTPHTGSEIRISRDDMLSGKYAPQIREYIRMRGVIVIRDAHLDDQELRDFTCTLGDLRLGTTKKEGDGGLQKVTNDPRQNPEYAYYFFGSQLWHMDGTYDEIPPFASILTPRVLSARGGDTLFTNTYAAYEALSDEDKALCRRLKVVHSMQAALFPARRDCTPEEFAQWCTYPTRVHPLVWQHESGRQSLVLSTSASHVVDMDPTDSHDLLQRLMIHATQDRYVYRHKWRMGDVLVWDNTGTMHRVLPFDNESGRRMHRYTLNGEEPVAFSAAG